MSRQQPLGMSYGAWAGMVAMALVGVAGAGLAVIAAFFVAYGGASDVAIFAVFAGLTIVPATILWFIGNRYLRAGAVGLAAAFLSASLFVLWSPWTTMSDGEVERAKAKAVASEHAAFYLGDEVDGYPLNDHYLGPDQANFFYGECHEDPNTEGEEFADCPWDVEVYTSWTDVTIGGDAIAGCVRQDPLAGVPTVHLHHQVHLNDQVVLFTGDSQVRIEVGAEPSVEEQLRVAAEVRQVGDTEAAASLPPPRPNILAYVEKNCAPVR